MLLSVSGGVNGWQDLVHKTCGSERIKYMLNLHVTTVQLTNFCKNAF